MRIFVPRETEPGEPRAAVTPDAVQRYGRKEGAVVAVESGAGAGCHYADDQYREAGAETVRRNSARPTSSCACDAHRTTRSPR